MAQKAIITITDDLDGTTLAEQDAETVSFALDGKSFEIDLSLANARGLRAALLPYTDAGRKIAKRTSRKTGATSPSGSRSDLAEIRAWARENGHEVADRGRIHGHIVDAFDAAHAR